MSEEIARAWLASCADTANALDLPAHMNLISKRVSLTGVPGFDQIGYDDWYAQCQHEFTQRLLKQVQYAGLKLVGATGTRIMFQTYETVEGSDGTVNAQGVEMLLEKEADGVWRLVQERVLSEAESRHYQLI